MTPRQINVAIAKANGWRNIAYSGARDRVDGNEQGGQRAEIPNYHESLDAIVPIVRDSDPEIRLKTMQFLCNMFLEYTPLATPAQWCKAYLKAIGRL